VEASPIWRVLPDSGASYDKDAKKLVLKDAKLPLKVKLPKVPVGFDMKQTGFPDEKPAGDI